MTNPQTWFCRLDLRNSHLTRQVTDVSLFYLCSCFRTQFLYRTAAKATFNVKDNIKIVKKIRITLTINITTLPTKIRKIGGKTTSAYCHFLWKNNIIKANQSQEQNFVFKNNLLYKITILYNKFIKKHWFYYIILV